MTSSVVQIGTDGIAGPKFSADALAAVILAVSIAAMAVLGSMQGAAPAQLATQSPVAVQDHV